MKFWKKAKEIKTEEFLELKKEIDMLWLEVDVLTKRYKRKVTSVQQDVEESAAAFNDGFDDLRKLNKG